VRQGCHTQEQKYSLEAIAARVAHVLVGKLHLNAICAIPRSKDFFRVKYYLSFSPDSHPTARASLGTTYHVTLRTPRCRMCSSMARFALSLAVISIPLQLCSGCDNSCYDNTCDYYHETYGYDCFMLEEDFGCDCFDCACPAQTTTTTTTTTEAAAAISNVAVSAAACCGRDIGEAETTTASIRRFLAATSAPINATTMSPPVDDAACVDIGTAIAQSRLQISHIPAMCPARVFDCLQVLLQHDYLWVEFLCRPYRGAWSTAEWHAPNRTLLTH